MFLACRVEPDARSCVSSISRFAQRRNGPSPGARVTEIRSRLDVEALAPPVDGILLQVQAVQKAISQKICCALVVVRRGRLGRIRP